MLRISVGALLLLVALGGCQTVAARVIPGQPIAGMEARILANRIDEDSPPCPPFHQVQGGQKVDFYIVRGTLLATSGDNRLVIECAKDRTVEIRPGSVLAASEGELVDHNTIDIPICPVGSRHDFVTYTPSGGLPIRTIIVPAPDLAGKSGEVESPFQAEVFRVYLPPETIGVRYLGLFHQCVKKPWNY